VVVVSRGDARRGGGRRVREEMHVGEGHRIGEMRVDEGQTSARPSSPAAGHDDARVSGRGVASGRSGASEKGGTSERSLSSGRGASGRGATRSGGGDDDGGREARCGDLGKTTKCRSGRQRGLYRTPTFCHGPCSQP
jgi:hypothetical protein